MALVLVASLGFEILPWGFVESTPAAPGAQSESTFCLEPLQVCDHGDSFLGVLFDIPVLPPETPGLFPPHQLLPLARKAFAFAPDGFHPSIDRPPRLSA